MNLTRTTFDPGGDAIADTIGGMFDIPEQQIVEQAEDVLTIGDTGKTDTTPEEPWDPFAGW